MPKIFGRDLPPVVIGGMAVLAIVLVYTAAVPPEAAPVRSSIRKPKATTAQKGSMFTPEDYSIRFASVNEPVRNSFRPLVVRQDIRAAPAGGPKSLPGVFTGDDGVWVYTGMAVVNGVSQGLLENRKTGDAEFVTRGERWKLSTIAAINEDSITLAGPTGELFTMVVGTDSELPATNNVSAPGGVAPVTVPGNLMGEIGIQPMPNGNNEGRRRPRRNRDNSQGNQEEE